MLTAMMKHVLIPGTSLRVSEIALGAMPWGTRAPADAAAALYDAYRAAGGNVVDTAHIYAAWEPGGGGASERAVGEVLRRHGDRRQVIVISKGGHPAEPFYPRPDRYLAPETVRRDITESLDRLGLDMIDLYFLHRDDRRVPVGEIIDLLNEEVLAGRIRYFGASNWATDRLEAANRYADGGSYTGFVASQPEFNLARPNAPMHADDPALRWLSPADVAWHARTGLPAFCYSPAARGYFATAGQRGATAYDNDLSRARLARATGFAAHVGATVSQIALAYVLAQPFPAFPIVGTADPAHLRDALGAPRFRLTADQVRWLENGPE
jgi:aryl-alcohol dehydrogenase-like predicted oxidoreductase